MPPTFYGKMGRLLVDEALPEDLRKDRVLDSAGLTDLMKEIAAQHPDKFRDISHKLNQLGENAAQQLGGYSFGLHAMRRAASANIIRDRIRGQVQQLLDDDSISDEARETKIIKLLGQAQPEQEKAVYDESLQENNPIALQIKSGARGKKMALNSLRGSDLLYVDHRNRPVPIPVLKSYAEGLSPAEYWAAAYGARHGIVSVKLGTAESGFLAKQLNQATHRLLVTSEADQPGDTIRGLPVDVDDKDNVGALLAHPAGGFERNTPLTQKILNQLNDVGISRILVRSPTVGGAPDGGLYSRDVGIRETGQLPRKGTFSGLQAGQALSEPLSQATLSSKHAGGVAGASKSVSGFAWINSLVQIPKVFPGGATHAETDGQVQQITKAPGGGVHVQVNGLEHYVPQGVELKVRPGDTVEAGDVLSDGIPSPAEIVKHKGIGEGRRYFVSAMRKALTDSGVRNNRRNIELVSRGLINHVELTEEIGEHSPEDVVPFDVIEHDYEPRPGAQTMPVKQATGHYLEKPYLHHTIGTQVKPSMLADFKHFGIEEVHVHKDPPPFKPVMVRGMYNLKHDPDVMTRMLGSGLKDSFLDSVHRGGGSDERGTSYVPGLARTVDFGRVGVIKPTSILKAALFGMENGAGAQPATLKPGVSPIAPKPQLAPPTPGPGAGEIKGFGDFFGHVGNLLRGPGYDAGGAPATAGFKNTASPQQFGQGLIADRKNIGPPMPAGQANFGQINDPIGDKIRDTADMGQLGLGAAQAGAWAMGKKLPVPKLGPGGLGVQGGLVAVDALRTGAGAMGLPEEYGGKNVGPNDLNQAMQRAPEVHNWQADPNRPWWVRAGDQAYNYANQVIPALENPTATFMDLGKSVYDIPHALWNSFGKSSAEGIPDRSDLGDLSKLEAGKLYSLFTQLHEANRAGRHTDLRVGSPETGLYSWAVRKGLPEPGQKHLAVRQPMHSHEYGSWSGKIPDQEYGGGTVTNQIDGQALVTDAGADKLHFTTAHSKHPQRFALINPKKYGDNNYLLLNTTKTEPLPYEKIHYKKVPTEQVEDKLKELEPGTSVQAKIDGASSLVKLLKDQLELYSYRASKPSGHAIVHTEKVLHGRPKYDLPSDYRGSILRGELHGVRTDETGKETTIHPSELGGILNATLAHSLEKQKDQGVKLRSALYDIQQVGNTPIDLAKTPYSERREHLKSILPSLPSDIFHLTDEAHTPEAASKLWQDIGSGQHPATEEGIVIHPPTGKPMKAKYIEDHDVHIQKIFPGEGRLAGTHAGGFEYSDSPDGPIMGRVGTGFSDDVRKQMAERPAEYIGRVARVKSQEKLPSGALRAPSFISLHEDYPLAKKAAVMNRVKELREKRSATTKISTAKERLLAIRTKNLGL